MDPMSTLVDYRTLCALCGGTGASEGAESLIAGGEPGGGQS